MTGPFSNRRASSMFARLGNQGPTPSDTITTALDMLDGAPARLQQVRRQHGAEVDRIRAQISQDPNLTAEGRLAALRERTAQAGYSAAQAIHALRDEIESAENTIDRVVEASWPKPIPGVEGLLGRQACWARVRTLLDADMTMSKVIAETDDVETLFSLRDELPTWARSKGANADGMNNIVEKIDLRIAQVTSGTTEADLTAKYQARVIIDALEPLLKQAEAEALGHAPFGSGLTAAIASQLAGQVARAAVQPITGPDGSVL